MEADCCIQSHVIASNSTSNMSICSNSLFPTATMWVYEHYKILSDFQAQCKECPETLCYISTEILQQHLKDEHRISFEYEGTWKDECWKDFRKIDDSPNVQCITCCMIIPFNDETVDHQHFIEERQLPADNHWAYKYCKKICSYVVTCIICEKKFDLEPLPETFDHIRIKHPNIWGSGPKLRKNERKTESVDLAIIRALIDDSLFKCNQMEIGEEDGCKFKINKTWLIENYDLTYSIFRAKCRKCPAMFTSVQVKHLTYHIFTKHREIYNFEQKRDLFWISFRRTEEHEMECIMCINKIFSLGNQDWKYHRHFAKDNIYLRHFTWQFKYLRYEYLANNCTFQAICCFCFTYITMMPTRILRIHIEKCHPIIPSSFQKESQLNNELIMYDGPSTSRETNAQTLWTNIQDSTTGLTWKINDQTNIEAIKRLNHEEEEHQEKNQLCMTDLQQIAKQTLTLTRYVPYRKFNRRDDIRNESSKKLKLVKLVKKPVPRGTLRIYKGPSVKQTAEKAIYQKEFYNEDDNGVQPTINDRQT